MSREDEEVSIEFLNVNLGVGYGLCSVDEHGNAVGVGYADDGAHIIDSAEGVVDMTNRHKLGLGRDETLKFREYQVAVLINGYGTQLRSLCLGYLLPRHDVGMMVEGGNYDVIALGEKLSAKGLCHEVDALGGATHEYYVLL